MRKARNAEPKVVVSIDRVVFSSDADLRIALAALPSFCTEADHRLFGDASTFQRRYQRARTLRSDATKTRLFVEYKPRQGWTAALRVAVVPDDHTGTGRRELEAILKAFQPYRLFVVEVAIDFIGGSR